MSGFRKHMQRLASVALFSFVTVTLFAVASPSAGAQGRRPRRESNASRRSRIERATQETYTQRYELFGGGGFLRFSSGEFLRKNSEVTWATSATYFLNPKLGITGDVRGAYGDARIGNTAFNIANPLITEYTFQGGVTYRFYSKMRFAISGNALGGYALGNFDGGSKAISATKLGMWATSDRPVLSGGISFDYNIYPNLAVRVMPTYVGTMFRGVNPTTGASDGSIQNNLGFNAGIVVRFGKTSK